MPFVVYVAADLYNQKVNLELAFPSLPTLGELHNLIQSTFANECLVLRPPSAVEQRFGILKLQLFNDTDGSWLDVTSPSVLQEFAQLYVFQSDPNYHESQQQIMPARRPSPTVSAPPAAPVTPVSTPGVPVSPAMNRQLSPSRSRNIDSSIVAGTSLATLAGSPRRSTVNVPPPVAVPRGHHPGESATTNDKIRYVFEEMDMNKNRVIETEEFRRTLRDLNIDFSAQTVGDLFRKADADRDGVVSLGEFATFFAQYPTMLDSVFFRLKDVIESRALNQELAAETAQLDSNKEQRNRASNMVAESATLLEQQTKKITMLEAERAEKVNRERDMRQNLTTGESELDRSLRDRNEFEHALGLAREREVQRRAQLSDTQRVVSECEGRVAQGQAKVTAAEERVRQIQAMLQEAQLEAERLHKVHYDSQVELSNARERETQQNQAHATSAEEVRRSTDQLQLAEREHLLRQEKQKELQSVAMEQQADLARLSSRIDGENRDLELCRERERSNRNLLSESEAAVQLQERRVVAKDQEIQQFAQRRAAMEQKERPLLDQEVRLREQRESLEEKELRLRRDAGSLFTDPTRVSTRRSPSPTNGYGAAGSSVSGLHHSSIANNSTRHLSPQRR